MNEDDFDPVEAATEAWREVFDQGPHTSLRIIEKLRTHLRLEYTDILRRPDSLRMFDPHVVDTMSDEWNHIWSSRSGRCTSFAVKVVHLLEQRHGARFQFRFFDIGGHRVARCERTGVVIDSVSSRGAVVLPDNVGWRTPAGLRGCWKYHQETGLKFERDSTPAGASRIIDPIDRAEAMAICTKEIADRAVLLCMFRGIYQEPDTEESVAQWYPAYYGLLRWNIAEKRLELIPNNNNRSFKLFVAFGTGRGNERTQMECIIQFQRFIDRYGFQHQWTADQLDGINMRFWQAATSLWGYPVWQVDGTPSST